MPQPASPRDRYTTVAIWLHWLIAALILANLALGLAHESVSRGLSQQMLWWHKSFGITVLLLSLVRLGWRLTHPAPPLPAYLPAWEKMLARLSHWAFYGLMLGLPLTGWMLTSASPQPRPIPFYGLDWPKLPFWNGLEEAARKAASHEYGEWHEWLAWTAIALLVLHVAAALKHQFWNRDVVMSHMLPGVKPGVDARLNAEEPKAGREL